MPDSANRPSEIHRNTCPPLNTADLTLSRAGGKGLNLARLAGAGFPVPEGFIVATDGYHEFVEHAGITDWMATESDASDTSDPAALTALSHKLRARFRANEIPAALATQICTAYAELGRPPVAVRSSATAEDLPGMSFAGQQDTILNVLGDDALLLAVVECWSSLWTARAISYREHNGIDQSAVSLAVVVQKMVPGETSGVLFTANPITGRRAETVIDATFGLGEALVSGQVEPDHYIVESLSGRILEKQLGAKATETHGLDAGGVNTVQVDRRKEQALSDQQITRLTEMGQRVADQFDIPQDIEWAFAEGALYLLQSRPITSLFPLPSHDDDGELRVFVSLGAIQGVMGPFTPLGLDVIRGLFAGIANLFARDATIYDQRLIWSAADRPWIEVTGALRNPFGRLLFSKAFQLVEPGAAQSIRQLISDPRLKAGSIHPGFLSSGAPVFIRILRSAVRTFLRPEAVARDVRTVAEEQIAAVRARVQAAGTLDDQVQLLEWLCYNAHFPFLIPLFMPPILVGYASLAALNRLASLLSQSDPDISPQLALDLTRGLPNNVTTEMDLKLWKVAKKIGEDSAGAAAFVASDPETLAHEYRRKELPSSIQNSLEGFLQEYGMRGLAEIDFGQPRWREQPLPLIRALQSYLAISDENSAPDRAFRQGEQAAIAAAERLANAAASRWDTPLAGWLVNLIAKRVRILAGFRESPKFTMIRINGIARNALLKSGQELADSGVLEQADDLFYLTIRELKTLAMNAPGDWQKLVRARRETYRNEQRRQPIPRLLLSDGTAIYEGLGATISADEASLAGSGVSPGVVEGTVQVVYNPLEASIQPGDILVCPGTDPSWTPLFLASGGLVMEVGGMMTHGSVVAREYGLPAVVGVDRATERLKTGQKVRVDGSSGLIEILN